MVICHLYFLLFFIDARRQSLQELYISDNSRSSQRAIGNMTGACSDGSQSNVADTLDANISARSKPQSGQASSFGSIDPSATGGLKCKLSVTMSRHGAWRSSVASAMRLRELLSSKENIAALRKFVGIKLQFRHLSGPRWTEWFANELKLLVVEALHQLQNECVR